MRWGRGWVVMQRTGGVSLAPVDALSDQNANNGKVMRHFTFLFLFFFVSKRGLGFVGVARNCRRSQKKSQKEVSGCKSHGRLSSRLDPGCRENNKKKDLFFFFFLVAGLILVGPVSFVFVIFFFIFIFLFFFFQLLG